MVWSSNLHVGYLVTNEVDCRPRENDHVFLSGFWSINCTLLRLPKWRRNVSSSFAKGYHWSKFQLHIIYGSWESSTNHVCTKSPTYEGLISHTLHLSLYFAFWLFFRILSSALTLVDYFLSSSHYILISLSPRIFHENSSWKITCFHPYYFKFEPRFLKHLLYLLLNQ